MKYLLSFLLLFGSLIARGETKIAPDDKRIVIEGAMHLACADDRMTIDRFSSEMWQRPDLNNFSRSKALTQSGVRICFKTDSRTVKPLFSDREGADLRKPSNFYGVYRNGEFIGALPGDRLVLESSGKGAVEWEIVLPIYYGVDFEGLLLDDGARLFDVKRKKRPVYVAIGDSITHGAGQSQCGSEGSYPFVLASINGYYLYNLGVGGSQISPAVTQELTGIKADVITVLWGFNDWNGGTRGDIDEIARRYEALLSELRRVQPAARIYCILPTTAADESGTRGKRAPGKPLGEVRKAERGIVEKFIAQGDEKLFLIEGDKLSAVGDLKGNVHFDNEGAKRFGKALAELVK